MRLAGSQEILSTLAGRFAAERADSELDSFFEAYELLKSKGYDPSTAEVLAVDMAKGRQPMAEQTTRFARIYGDAPGNAIASDSRN